MFNRVTIALSLVALTAVLAVAGCGTPATPVVKKVDHVTLFTQNAQQLFDFFTTKLGLPAAWPLSNYPQFSTGGVQAGNVNMETLQAGPPAPTGSAGPQASIYGIVLEPVTPLSKTTSELQARGAKPGKPTVQTAEVSGKTVPVWTNVTLNALARPHYTVYLTEYSQTYTSLLGSHKVSGPLGKIGVTKMDELVISAKDPTAVQKQWQTAFAPAPMSSGVMTIGTGPDIQIVKGTGDDIVTLMLEVESLSKAKDYLQSQGLLGQSTASELTIAPAAVQGLDIRIVAKSK